MLKDTLQKYFKKKYRFILTLLIAQLVERWTVKGNL